MGGDGDVSTAMDTDYLVVGAGASAMAFVDAVLAGSDARAIIIDRRHRPGGHWLDAYPFVRLHQPSANYGVASRPLGLNRIDSTGPNAGFYERATANEICDYFLRVLEENFVASGRVRFLPMTDYQGEDAEGHHVTSLLTGGDTIIRARKLVDATYIHSEIPSRRRPAYEVDPGVRVIPPNDLVNLIDAPTRFTIVGAGKTAMDTCNWLLDRGVNPNSIRWIRPRDPWLFDRVCMQPLDLVGSYMGMQARWVEAAARADNGADFARRLEASGVLVRIDDTIEADAWRGAIIGSAEVDALRSIDHVIRGSYVRRIGSTSLVLDTGELDSSPGEVYVDCTAPGVRPTLARPVFEANRITLQLVTIGIVPWSTATVGFVETSHDDDVEKNRLCPPITFTGRTADILNIAYTAMMGIMARGQDPELAAWTDACRLNPAAGAMARASEPEITSALRAISTHIGDAVRNLEVRVAEPAAG